MNLPLTDATHVFAFIIFSSFYVCSILWIYGDAATRGAGWKGLILPLLFIAAGVLAFINGLYLALLVWPAGYVAWLVLRPARTVELTD